MAKNRCSECGAAGSGQDGLCTACRKVEEGEYESRADYFAELGRKGAQRQKEMRVMDGVSPSELPPLEDHAAAEVWLDVVGRAVVVGRLDNRNAQAAIRAVDTFLKARAEKEQSERIGELRRKMEDLEAELEARRNDRPWE